MESGTVISNLTDIVEDTKLVPNEKVSFNEDQTKEDTYITKEVPPTESTGKVDFPIMKCAICSGNYSEDRLPRNLVCGHSLCTPCAVDCLAATKLCPECHEKQLIDDATDFPVNYPLLRLVRSIGVDEIVVSNVTASIYPVDIPNSDQQEDIYKCGAHGNPVAFLCCSCSMWVCQDCLVVDHPLLPRGSCRILGLADGMSQVRNEHGKVAYQTLKEIDIMKGIFDSEVAMHRFSLKYCSHGNKSHDWLTQKVEGQLEELKKNNDLAVENAKERVRKSTDVVNTTTSTEEMTTACKEILDCQKAVKEDKGKENESILPVMKTTLEHLKMDLKPLVEGKEPVYAILDGDEGPKWAPITIRKDRLLLSCLNEGRPPKEGITIPYEYARKLVPSKNTTVYFEVGTEEELLGRIYVRLNDDHALAQQIALMCSGENGVSYRNTCFYKYDEKDGLLRGGDYENNDGTGGTAILRGLGKVNIESVYQKTAGCLVAERVSARFHFHLRNVSKPFNDVVGKTTEGLKVLRDLAKMEPVTKAVIRDCGLFIPMNLEEPAE